MAFIGTTGATLGAICFVITAIVDAARRAIIQRADFKTSIGDVFSHSLLTSMIPETLAGAMFAVGLIIGGLIISRLAKQIQQSQVSPRMNQEMGR